MNFRELTEDILNENYRDVNNIDIPLIPSKELDLSEFYSFRITPSTLDNNVTSPKRSYPFLKGKADMTPSEEDTVQPFMYGDELTFEEALYYAEAAVDKINIVRKGSAERAIQKIFSALKHIPGVFHVVRSPKDVTFLFRVDTAFLRMKRIQSDLQDADTAGFEDLL